MVEFFPTQNHPKEDILNCNPLEMRSVYNVNVVGPLMVFQALYLKYLKPVKKCKIINIGSQLGSITRTPTFGLKGPSYCCSKAATNMLTAIQAKQFTLNENRYVLFFAHAQFWKIKFKRTVF